MQIQRLGANKLQLFDVCRRVCPECHSGGQGDQCKGLSGGRVVRASTLVSKLRHTPGLQASRFENFRGSNVFTSASTDTDHDERAAGGHRAVAGFSEGRLSSRSYCTSRSNRQALIFCLTGARSFRHISV